MQDLEHAMEIRDILDRIKTIRSCEHEPEVEARYGDHEGFRFQMCRECWNRETFHRISEDYVQVVRPNQLDAVSAKCIKCGSGMDSCGCGTA